MEMAPLDQDDDDDEDMTVYEMNSRKKWIIIEVFDVCKCIFQYCLYKQMNVIFWQCSDILCFIIRKALPYMLLLLLLL